MILHGGCMNEFRDFLTMDADARPVRAGIEKLDVPAFRDFLARVYQRALPDADAERIRLLQDMNLATEEGFLNLACALLFTATRNGVCRSSRSGPPASGAIPYMPFSNGKMLRDRFPASIGSVTPSSCATCTG